MIGIAPGRFEGAGEAGIEMQARLEDSGSVVALWRLVRAVGRVAKKSCRYAPSALSADDPGAKVGGRLCGRGGRTVRRWSARAPSRSHVDYTHRLTTSSSHDAVRVGSPLLIYPPAPPPC